MKQAALKASGLATLDTDYQGLVGDQPGDIVPVSPAWGPAILTVGAGEEFSTIAAAVAAASNGDVIEVNAGTYTNDFATITKNITLIGVGGMVNMVATVPPHNLKGIITVDASCTIDNFSFSGAAIDPGYGGNGAGIRYEGGDMVLNNDSFQDNQNGLLAFPVLGLPSNTIVLNGDTFNANGSGTGYTHNAYIGAVDSLTVTNCLFEQCNVGNELKSRALINTIDNNSFYDGPTADPSYDIDLPNGGVDVVQNNTIEKGPNAQNENMVHFSGEGTPYAGSSLLVQGNTFVGDLSTAVGVFNQSTITVTVAGNSFDTMTSSQVAIGPATEINNVDGTGQAFPNETPGGVISGATITFADSQAHSITLGDNSIAAVYGGAGLLTVTAVAAGITAVGGSGGMAYTEQPPSSGNSIATAAGSSNVLTLSGSDVIDSEGTDTITTAGPLSGTIRGNAVITSSGGGVSLVLTGIDVFSGQGNDTLAVAAGAVATVTDSGFASVTETGARVSFTGQTSGPSATVTVTGGGALIHSDAAGGLSVTTAAGQSTVVQMGAGQQSVTSASDDRIYGGTGTDTIDTTASGVSVWCESGAVTVVDGDAASKGATTVYGGAGSLSLGGGVDALTFIGGSGSAVITGGSGAVHVSAGSGALTLSSGSGPTTFIGSSGSANLSLGVAGGAVQFGIGATTVNEAGSGSADIYTLVATRVGASDVINGFRVGTDKLVLNGVSVLGETLSGGSGGIAFSDHIQLTLTGVTDLAAVFG